MPAVRTLRRVDGFVSGSADVNYLRSVFVGAVRHAGHRRIRRVQWVGVLMSLLIAS
jgi:hypothetical protein